MHPQLHLPSGGIQTSVPSDQSTSPFASFQYNASSYTIPDTYSYIKYAFLHLLFTMADNMFLGDIHTITSNTNITFNITSYPF
jgi:hypothetical protein